MGNLGVPEMLLIALVILVFFGAKKIPDIAQGLGKGIREFRKASRDLQADDDSAEAGSSSEEKVACPHCGAAVPKGAKFCHTCGKSLEGEKCPKCGHQNVPGSKFCKECGTKLAA